MEFKRKGPNVAEISCGDGRRILFSYGEPVAAFVTVYTGRDMPTAVTWRIDEFVSRTTEQHIAEFLEGRRAARVPRAELQRITKEAR